MPLKDDEIQAAVQDVKKSNATARAKEATVEAEELDILVNDGKTISIAGKSMTYTFPPLTFNALTIQKILANFIDNPPEGFEYIKEDEAIYQFTTAKALVWSLLYSKNVKLGSTPKLEIFKRFMDDEMAEFTAYEILSPAFQEEVAKVYNPPFPAQGEERVQEKS